MWFLHGSNSVVIPRGVFYGSELFQAMNGSWDTSSPLSNATIHGNSNNLSSSLNSRVIQMVIAKNLTLAEAWGILDLALTNSTGNITAFPFFATSEFTTLGFVDEVAGLVANTAVVNSGNHSAPPPPLEWWQLLWNTVAGWAERAWNALLAVAEFFRNVVKWLVDFAIGVVIGLTTGDWDYFQNNVVDPLAKAIQAALDFIMNFIRVAVELLFKPLLDTFESWKQEGLRLLAALGAVLFEWRSSDDRESPKGSAPSRGTRGATDGPTPTEILGTPGQAPPGLLLVVEVVEFFFLAGTVATLLLTIAAALIAFEIVIKFATAGLALAATTLISNVIIAILITMIFGVLSAHVLRFFFSNVLDLVPDELEDVAFGALTVGDLILSIGIFLGKERGSPKFAPFVNTAMALKFAILSLLVMGLGLVVGPIFAARAGVRQDGLIVNFVKAIIDFVACMGSAWGLNRLKKDAPVEPGIQMVYKAVKIIDETAMILSVSSVVLDFTDMFTAWREGNP